MNDNDLIIQAPMSEDQAKLLKNKHERRKEALKNRATILKDFKKWVKTDHKSEYDAYTPVGGLILIRLYLYEPPQSNIETPKLFTGFDDDGSGYDRLKSQMYPFIKVLKIGDNMPENFKNLAEGDIYTIPDEMCGVQENESWREWQFMKREKPSIDEDWPMPPRYIPTLGTWGKFLFKGDKFLPGDLSKDGYTFMIPPSLLRSKVDVNLVRT